MPARGGAGLVSDIARLASTFNRMVDRLERVQFVLEHHDHQGAVLGVALYLHRDQDVADGAGTALEGARCWIRTAAIRRTKSWSVTVVKAATMLMGWISPIIPSYEAAPPRHEFSAFLKLDTVKKQYEPQRFAELAHSQRGSMR